MVKNVITNLDSSRAPGPDCIPVLVLKKCEPDFCDVLAEHFNNCLKDSCLTDFSSVVPVFSRSIGESLQLKATALLVFFLWLVKSLKNL